MNPPGKALKRGVTHVDHATPSPVPKPVKKPARKIDDTSRCAPVFAFLGLILFILGIVAVSIGLATLVVGESGSSTPMILSGGGCLFWSAMMYALAEALTRLAEISKAVRSQSER